MFHCCFCEQSLPEHDGRRRHQDRVHVWWIQQARTARSSAYDKYIYIYHVWMCASSCMYVPACIGWFGAGIKIACMYGGSNKREQRAPLRMWRSLSIFMWMCVSSCACAYIEMCACSCIGLAPVSRSRACIWHSCFDKNSEKCHAPELCVTTFNIHSYHASAPCISFLQVKVLTFW